MQKYKLNRKLITVICDFCGCEYQKPKSEYDRNLKLNRSSYCSRNCSGKSCNKNGLQKGNDYFKTNKFLKSSDIYTPFRYYLRNSKKRYKDFDLSVEYLKEVWDSQNGICPYSGIPLKLSTYSISYETIYRASLDRIDSSLGYIKGNVQFVSTAINYMKGTMTHEQTIEMCILIAKNYNKQLVS